MPDRRAAMGESVLARAVRILEVFSPEEDALSVSQIARRTGLHVATASRLIAELTGYGLLARGEDGLVRVGMRLWELASRASPALALREIAMPFLEGLHDVVGHHVQLGVLEGGETLFLERLSAPRAVINYTRIAGRLPLHASSSGLVLLAGAPPCLLDEVLAQPLRRFTGSTPATPARLRAELAEIRRTGVAYCPGYMHVKALGIAAPIHDPRDGHTVAALSAIVPNEPARRALIPVVQASARGITRALASTRATRAAGADRSLTQ